MTGCKQGIKFGSMSLYSTQIWLDNYCKFQSELHL